MEKAGWVFKSWVSFTFFGALLVGQSTHASCGSDVAALGGVAAPIAQTSPLFRQRGAGILLAVSSLPGEYGIGDFKEGYKFVRWLKAAKQSWWQVLPLNPTDISNSSFSSESALALDAVYLDVDNLVSLGLLHRKEADALKLPQSSKSDFGKARANKQRALDQAFQRFGSLESPSLYSEFRDYRRENRYWLTDHSSFLALKEIYGYDFTQWPKKYKDRHYTALAAFRLSNKQAILRLEFEQFILDRQWTMLKKFANANGVRVIGDMPLYMTRFSANVWANPDSFLLDADKAPCLVSGYPPCNTIRTASFGEHRFITGKVCRIRATASGFSACAGICICTMPFGLITFWGCTSFYAVDASASHARDGEWKPAQGTELLKRLVQTFGTSIPLIAEDLGASVPPEVHTMRQQFGVPGMYILQFGQGGAQPDPYHKLSEYKPVGIAYTGNHDMPTLKQWSATTSNLDTSDEWEWISRLMQSNANVAIVPAQDVLGLGADARMNEPGTWSTASDPNQRRDNWVWKLVPTELSAEHATKLKNLVEQSRR